MRKFGAERKSPIGYKPFALACMRQAKSGLRGDDTERYIDSYIEKVLWYSKGVLHTRTQKSCRRTATVSVSQLRQNGHCYIT